MTNLNINEKSRCKPPMIVYDHSLKSILSIVTHLPAYLLNASVCHVLQAASARTLELCSIELAGEAQNDLKQEPKMAI